MTILVIGGTGLVGSAVVKALAAGGFSIRATSRKTAIFPAGVEGTVVDLAVPSTLAAALQGVSAVFAYAEPETAAILVEELKRADIRRLVMLSSADAASDDMADFNSRRHREPERVIEQADLDWTFLRPGAFASNALFWKDEIRHTFNVRLPYPNARQSVIDPRDIGQVAVHALTSDKLIGAAPVLTGPESLPQWRQPQIIGEAIGRDVSFEEITPEEARRMLARFIPPEFVELKLTALRKATEHPLGVTDAVLDITGAPPRSFREWAIDNADAFR